MDAKDPKASPFKVGERLEYRVGWASFSSAATVRLAVAERRELDGWDTWHLQALAHTLNPVRALFAVDDQFDSYTDTRTLESRQYETYLHELGKEQSSVVRLAPAGVPARGKSPTVVVLPGTRDPVGALYSLRQVDWERTPETRAPIYDGKDLYEMRAHLEVLRDHVAVLAGDYSASKIQVRLYASGREVPQARFVLWLAQDPAQTPVLMEAELPFGNLRAELTGVAE